MKTHSDIVDDISELDEIEKEVSKQLQHSHPSKVLDLLKEFKGMVAQSKQQLKQKLC